MVQKLLNLAETFVIHMARMSESEISQNENLAMAPIQIQQEIHTIYMNSYKG